MRIAHLVMAHQYPEQLARLAGRLQHAQFDLYIHLDAKVADGEFAALSALPNVYFIQHRVRCQWGGFSFVTAIFSAVAEILQSGRQYGMINLISAQDYPLMPPEEMYRYLSARREMNFISYDPTQETGWWKDATQRYRKYHFTDYQFPGKYVLQKAMNSILPPRNFPGGMKLYGSRNSSWWTITTACAAHICKEFHTNTALRRFLKLCWGTDEFIIATLIMNSPYSSQVINDNLRYIDWSEGNAHPKVLTAADLPQLLKSGMLFARKFDLKSSAAVLDELDKMLS